MDQEANGHENAKAPCQRRIQLPQQRRAVVHRGMYILRQQQFHPAILPAQSLHHPTVGGWQAFLFTQISRTGYLAYFQSFSNTYADIDTLRARYEEALAVDGIRGLVISTRPDCLPIACLDYLEALSRHHFLTVEIGIESMNDNTLRSLNRQHDTACVKHATEALASRGIITCGHVILGLPQESEEEMLRQALQISRLPIQILKIHQLQVLRGTALARCWEQGDIRVSTPDEYLSLLAQYICRLRNDLVLERFFSSSPISMVIAPQWGIRPSILNNKLTELMREKGWHQGIFAAQK